jgi:penicillin-binding protein 1A
MNQIFLGQRAYGFAAASEIYFGKPLKEVSVAEAAMLAGLPKAPSAYNPIVNPSAPRQAQQYIIDRMVDNGFITETRARGGRQGRGAALPHPVRHVGARRVRGRDRAAAGVQPVRRRGLHARAQRGRVRQCGRPDGGLPGTARGLLDFELRQVYRGPEAFVDLPADPAALDARIADALADHPDNDELRSAVVLEASPRKVVAVLQMESRSLSPARVCAR